jgi:hypothetical protein
LARVATIAEVVTRARLALPAQRLRARAAGVAAAVDRLAVPGTRRRIAAGLGLRGSEVLAYGAAGEMLAEEPGQE